MGREDLHHQQRLRKGQASCRCAWPCAHRHGMVCPVAAIEVDYSRSPAIGCCVLQLCDTSTRIVRRSLRFFHLIPFPLQFHSMVFVIQRGVGVSIGRWHIHKRLDLFEDIQLERTWRLWKCFIHACSFHSSMLGDTGHHSHT